MKVLQSHVSNGCRVELHDADGKLSLYVAEVSGRDAVASVSPTILNELAGAADPMPDVIAALARDWSPEACALIERIRSVMHAIGEHKSSTERSALLDVIAAHMRSAAPMAGRAA